MQNTAVYRPSYRPSFNTAVVTAPGNTPWMPRALRTPARRWELAGTGF